MFSTYLSSSLCKSQSQNDLKKINSLLCMNTEFVFEKLIGIHETKERKLLSETCLYYNSKLYSFEERWLRRKSRMFWKIDNLTYVLSSLLLVLQVIVSYFKLVTIVREG